ncbi:MAG: class I SAM-dependent methyltransferase [Aestuariivirga sp.]
MPHWNVQDDYLELQKMPFYWRLSDHPTPTIGIEPRLGIRVRLNLEHNYLQYIPTNMEWEVIDAAYRQNENIGFINPESGQLNTYGSSVNNYFLKVIEDCQPRSIYEIGCGAGFTIQFLKEKGWDVTGIDPSEYSLRWSERLGFKIINEFFNVGMIKGSADLIYCNDVFEHVRMVEDFSRNVFESLKIGGAFSFATTNSDRSIELGDISMLEHQHVNMFTERSIHSILRSAGFTRIDMNKGSYGNTFHVTAFKGPGKAIKDLPVRLTHGFFERACRRIEAFERFYHAKAKSCGFYVPLRCIPWLAAVGDFGESDVFDSNPSWRGKFIDGYSQAIKCTQDVQVVPDQSFFVGSLTFLEEISAMLESKGVLPTNIFSILSV